MLQHQPGLCKNRLEKSNFSMVLKGTTLLAGPVKELFTKGSYHGTKLTAINRDIIDEYEE